MASSSKHVVVALRMAGIAGQDKLSGIFEFLSEGHRWNLAIYRTRHEFTAQTVRDEISRGASGFIVGIPEADDSLSELAKTDLPVILMNVQPGPLAKRKAGYLLVKSDASTVGRAAAHALLSQGVYKSYAYAGYRTDADWSTERGLAFRETLKKSGFSTQTFDTSHFAGRTEDRTTLCRWLTALPKPCGILAACDDRAYEIAEACNECGIKIPAEIGILGVNNDPLLCENSNPRLSSVQPDFRREGYLAALNLDRMTASPRKRTVNTNHPLLVGIKQLVHRESTYPLSNSGILVQKALAFIDRSSTKKISVPDVAAHLKVSRSLLDIRFRELQGETVHAAIIRARLNEVKRRLASTRDGIEKISSDCGWDSINSLKNIFHREVGMSMRSWRNTNNEFQAR